MDIDERILKDWARMKRLRDPRYWTQMRKRVVTGVRREWIGRIARYAAVLFCVLGGGYVCVTHFYQKELEWRADENLWTDVVPGKGEVRLYTSEGKVVTLGADSLSFEESDGTYISNMGVEGIVYESIKKDIRTNIFNMLVVPERGEYNITLSDGSRVWLNSGTTLKYPVSFQDSIREVYLNGEAFFEIQANEQCPFVVRTEKQTIRVVGTAFNVMDYKDDVYSHTTLARGRVEVQRDKERKMLVPGEQAWIEGEGAIRIKKVNVRAYTCWMADRFYFDGDNLEYIMKKLSRWYGVKICFEDEEAEWLHFVGSVPKYENIQEVCDIISLTTHLQFEMKNNILIIKTGKQKNH